LEEVAGCWRRLHNEEFRKLYASQNIVRVIKSRRVRWAGLVAHMGKMRHTYNITVGKPEGERPLRRPVRRLEVNVRTDLKVNRV
jgi:hypothetical protein